jgi:hypothetical protein
MVPALFSLPPTAMQAVAEVHDTAPKPLSVVPVGLGTDWIDQLVPFHRSAKGTFVEPLI